MNVQETFSTTKGNALRQLGEPSSRRTFERGKEKLVFPCGCQFDETDTLGNGVLFACGKHSE